MKIYVFEDGLARFATTPYEPPNSKNLNNMYMHLANYAINKCNSNFVQNSHAEGFGKGHKRSLKEIYNIMDTRGHNVKVIKKSIDDLIIKTLISGQPSLLHIYRSCQPEDLENQLCFQILGFDVMLDTELKPWLIEVNHAPSLATESVFDLNLKKKLVEDTLKLLNLSMKRKQVYLNNQKIQFQKRILTGKIQKLTQEEKDAKRLEIDKVRNQQEIKIMGGYRLIFPPTDVSQQDHYGKMLETSK